MELNKIISNFKQSVPQSKISTKSLGGQTIKYIAWHDYCDLLDQRAGLGNWSWDLISITETSPISQISGIMDSKNETYTKFVNARLIIVGKLTIHGDDRSISFSATGEELLNCSNYGDPSSNAEAMSLRRACAKAGLGRTLWQK